MVILGLTGSIAMGKTTAAAMFRRLGISVFDADRSVHHLLAKGGAAVAAVEAAFPGVVCGGVVDRASLARRVFGDQEALKRLESVLHPLVGRDERRFLSTAARRRRRVVVLDIPLLFETGGDADCDAVAVVSAPSFLQVERLAARPGMTRERIATTLARQMSDAEKRRRADFVIPSGLGRARTMRAIKAMVDEVSRWRGTKWTPSNAIGRIDPRTRRA